MGHGFARAVRPVELRWSDVSSLSSAVTERRRSIPGQGDGPHLWLSRTDRPVADAATMLGEEELAAARAMRNALRRERYIAGHAVLRAILASYLEAEPADLELARAPCPLCEMPHGRPVVARSPVGFSLSRCGPWALVAIAGAQVGVDLEAEVADERVAALSSRMHPLETERLAGLAGARLRREFTRVWVRKEAFLKALGTGLARGTRLDHVGAGPEPGTPRPGWSVYDVLAPDGYSAACAARSGRWS